MFGQHYVNANLVCQRRSSYGSISKNLWTPIRAICCTSQCPFRNLRPVPIQTFFSHATPCTQTISRGKCDRQAASKRIALSRTVSSCLVIITMGSFILLHRDGLRELALGRITVAVAGLLWLCATFTKASDHCRAHEYMGKCLVSVIISRTQHMFIIGSDLFGD